MGDKKKKELACLTSCLATRRQFLIGSGVTSAAVILSGMPGMGTKEVHAAITKYPRQLVGKLNKLKVDKPVLINYPDKGKFSTTMLVKLGTRAGEGVGPDNDIVAFNVFCTHMGGDMKKTYSAADKTIGQCTYHLSTFDLTRYGMPVSSHATQNLPQVMLEVDGNDIYATGMMGLIYGRFSNI